MQQRQGTLFDEEMRATAERATLWADALRQQLTDAEARIAVLEQERAVLRERVRVLEYDLHTAEWLRRVRQAYGLSEPGEGERDRLVRALTKLAAECHPDRWQGAAVAEECVKRVLAVRDTFMQ